MNRRLSPAQLAALRRVAAGRRPDDARPTQHTSAATIANTVKALQRRGLIVVGASACGTRSAWLLTDAGRAALERDGGTP